MAQARRGGVGYRSGVRRRGVKRHRVVHHGVGPHGVGRHGASAGVGRRRRASLIAILKALSLAQVFAHKEVRQLRQIKEKESNILVFQIFKVKNGPQI